MNKIQNGNFGLEDIRPHCLNCSYKLPSSVLCQWCNMYNYLVTSYCLSICAKMYYQNCQVCICISDIIQTVASSLSSSCWMLNVEASKAAHNLISKWVIAKLILKLPGPYYFSAGSWKKNNIFLLNWRWGSDTMVVNSVIHKPTSGG